VHCVGYDASIVQDLQSTKYKIPLKKFFDIRCYNNLVPKFSHKTDIFAALCPAAGLVNKLAP
jgi:hypothetical protein